VPCPGGRLYPKRFYQKTPAAVDCLADLTLRTTEAGARASGAVHYSPDGGPHSRASSVTDRVRSYGLRDLTGSS
jgi:hypothetical protein